MLGVPPRTLAAWAYEHRGPRHFVVGKGVSKPQLGWMPLTVLEVF